MTVRRTKLISLLTFCVWLIALMGHLAVAADEIENPDLMRARVQFGHLLKAGQDSLTEDSPMTAEQVYEDIYEICSQVPLISTDYSSIHPRDTTTLPSFKPLTESFKDAATEGRLLEWSHWLSQVIESPGFTQALDDCYPMGGPPEEQQLSQQSRNQFIFKLQTMDALGKPLSAVTFGLALDRNKAKNNPQQSQQTAQEKIRAIHSKFHGDDD